MKKLIIPAACITGIAAVVTAIIRKTTLLNKLFMNRR